MTALPGRSRSLARAEWRCLQSRASADGTTRRSAVINPGLMKNLATAQSLSAKRCAAAKLANLRTLLPLTMPIRRRTHFLIMEYVDGKTLADLLTERGSLPIPEACEYVRQAAIGLQHLFEAGLIHRDIKPQNLMRASNGTIKLLDCGLALHRRESAEPFCQSEIRDPQFDSGLTGAGHSDASATYIAPEQITDAHGPHSLRHPLRLHLLPPAHGQAAVSRWLELRQVPTACGDTDRAASGMAYRVAIDRRQDDGEESGRSLRNTRRKLPSRHRFRGRSASKGANAKRERPRRRSLIAATSVAPRRSSLPSS